VKLECLPFREIWAVDFEFRGGPGDCPVPICLAARELRTGRCLALWRDELLRSTAPPYPVDPGSLFCAYYASAEIGCHFALGWPAPARILDLYAEFRALTNGLPLVSGSGLIGALIHHGLDAIGAQEKHDMRDLILRGGPWTAGEQAEIQDYCASDVDSLARLLSAMLPAILGRPHGLGHGLLRGRSMAALARIEHNGVPIDVATVCRLRAGWTGIQDRLIREIDREYGVFEGRTFKTERFEAFLVRQRIPWPRLPTGALDLSDDSFREMARAYPRIAPLRELRSSLSAMRLADLAVGTDGRNRTILSAFRARTGRNQPSNSKFIFGPSTWLRGLVKPPAGFGVSYIDFASQEIGIAAALSGDERMLEAYKSGDTYMGFAKQTGLAPPEATKTTHSSIRDLCKALALGIIYGMGADALATRIGQSPAHARELLELHRRTYPVFWRWSQGAVDTAMLTGKITTVFGWPLHIGSDANERSIRNFPCQANAAEMLRLACCLGVERSVEICAPVHDAVLIAAPLDRLEDDILTMRAAMAEASRVVLGGFECGTDVVTVRYPDRYADPRGAVMWSKVMSLLDETSEFARVA
jgi:DNA polymerase I